MHGAYLVWARANLLRRDCAECRRFVIDERTGRPQTDSHGEPVRLGEKQTRRCEGCAKWDAEARQPWPGFSERNARAFLVCRACIEMGCLPRAGGAGDQEPASMTTLLELKVMKAEIDAGAAEARMRKLMAERRSTRG